MVYVGFPTIKILALLCAVLSCILAISLMVSIGYHRRIWANSSPLLDSRFWKGFDFGIGAGISILIVHLFGIMAIVLNGYGMLIVYLGGLVLAVACNTAGMFYYLFMPWDENIRFLDAKARNMTPGDLGPVERNFHCCGVEKYTDYFMIWKIFTDEDNPTRKKIDELLRNNSRFHPTTRGWRTTRVMTDKWGFGKKSLVNIEKKNLDNMRTSWKDKLITKYAENILTSRNKTKTEFYIYRFKNKRYIHPTARLRYEPHSIYALIKKYGIGIYDLIFGGISEGSQTPAGDSVKTKLAKKLYGPLYEAYKDMVPELIQDIVAGFIGSFLYWTEIFWGWKWRWIKWWFGSGWDDLFLNFILPNKNPMLPYSCCKIPSVECRGNLWNTWEEGCIFMLQLRWTIDVNRLTVSIGTYLLALAANIGVVVILIKGVKKKYYL